MALKQALRIMHDLEFPLFPNSRRLITVRVNIKQTEIGTDKTHGIRETKQA